MGLTIMLQMSGEDAEFLKNLAKELKTQNVRMTRQPILYGITEERKVSSEIPDEVEFFDADAAETFSLGELKELVREQCPEDAWGTMVGRLNLKKMAEIAGELDMDTAQEICRYLQEEYGLRLRPEGYRKVRSIDVNYPKLFLTEKGCSDYVNGQRHNLRKPEDFVFYAGHDTELERLLKIVMENFGETEVG